MVPLCPSSFYVPSNMCSPIPFSLISLRLLLPQLLFFLLRALLKESVAAFFLFSNGVCIFSLVLLTLAGGFYELSF
jgi:hypothetical protein